MGIGVRHQTLSTRFLGWFGRWSSPALLLHNPLAFSVRDIPSLVQTLKDLLLTTSVLQHLDQTAPLLLDPLLHSTLSHPKISQRGDGEAPELFGLLPTAECHTCRDKDTEGGER